MFLFVPKGEHIMQKDLSKTANLYKEVRELLGESQAQFAKRLNIAQGYLSYIESGKRNPNGHQVMEVLEIKRKALIKIANL